MSSVGNRLKQVPTNDAYFVNIADMRLSMLQNYTTVQNPTMSTASWLATAGTSTHSTLATAGRAFLRDMGKSLVSSGRVFRKVQLLTPNPSTSGVSGSGAGTSVDYFTAFIELPGLQGISSGAVPGVTPGAFGGLAPVARLG